MKLSKKQIVYWCQEQYAAAYFMGNKRVITKIDSDDKAFCLNLKFLYKDNIQKNRLLYWHSIPNELSISNKLKDLILIGLIKICQYNNEMKVIRCWEICDETIDHVLNDLHELLKEI